MCFGGRFVPFFLLDQSESLSRKPARLPSFDCSGDRRASEINCDAKDARGYAAEENKSADPAGSDFFRRNEVEIILHCTSAGVRIALFA